MAYVGVVKALYDYDAQNPEDELSFKEDQILYVIEKGDDEWWKAKLKDESGDGPLGLIPCTYVEEIGPTHQVRALYAYESTSPEELSMEEDAVLNFYTEEEDWVLVSVEGAEDKLGFVPRNYCEGAEGAEEDAEGDGVEAGAAVAGGGAAAAASAAAAAAATARDEERQRAAAAAKQRELAAKDKVETWSISELDGKKKKKASLSVGNGTIFLASESDKSPIRQYPITDLTHVEQESSKVVGLTIASLPQPLRIHTGSPKVTHAVVEKLASSKQLAGEALDIVEGAGQSSDEDEVLPPPTRRPSEPKTVRFTEPDSPVSPIGHPPSGGEVCTVLYDFEGKGDDELTVEENQQLTVVDRSDEEWWLVRNSQGQEGVVPAQYVEIQAGGASAPAANGTATSAAAAAAPAAASAADEERRREADARAQAAATAERQRREETARREAERQQREKAARERAERAERAEQEALDRELAQSIEAEERGSRRETDQRSREQKEFDNLRRRQMARQMGDLPEASMRRPMDIPPEARSSPNRERAAAPRPDQRPKPNPSRVRTWSDRTGQFTVEAEFLGLNGNKLRLHKVNGVIIEVPMEKMSPEDMQMVKRYQARRKERNASTPLDEEDKPLGWSHPPRRPSEQISRESQSRSQQPQQQPKAQQQPARRRPTFDWFGFFLEAGCDVDDCTRYGANFDRDRIDESILMDLDASTLRSLGLREGDLIRVRKHIQNKYGKKTPEQEAQISQDEALARRLQSAENNGKSGPAPAPPALFVKSDGKLANNTRRGRPERRGTLTDTVDAGALAAASDQLAKVSILEPSKPPTPPLAAPVPVSISPPPEEKQPEKPKSGFDDDAWAIKPVTKTAPSPAPPAATPSPGPANGTDALLAQIQSMRPSSTGPPPGGSAFESIAAANAAIPQRKGSVNMPPPSSYGLGAANTNTPMGQLTSQQAQAALQPPTPQAPAAPVSQHTTGVRGPLAPVPANEGLLNPMISQTTGMFIPTHGSGTPTQSPFAGGVPAGQYFAGAGMQPMVTGAPMMPMYTGYQQPQSSFNAIASIPPAQAQAPQSTGASGGGGGGGGDQFAPSNIFNAMKRTDYGKREEEQPQPAGKYDALRPLTTGYNGAPGAMYPQATGMPGMQMQPTGMMPDMGMGMGMPGGMGMQPTGMGMQPTGMGMGGMQQGMYPGQQMGYGGQGYGQY